MMMEVNKYFENFTIEESEKNGCPFDISPLWKYKRYPYEPMILKMVKGTVVQKERRYLIQKFRHLKRYWAAMEFEGALFEKFLRKTRCKSEAADLICSLNIYNLEPELIFKDFYVLFGAYADCLDSIYDLLKSDNIKKLVDSDYFEILGAVRSDADCYRKHALKTPLYLKWFLDNKRNF